MYDFGTNTSNVTPTFLEVRVHMYIFSQKRLIRKGLSYDLMDVSQLMQILLKTSFGLLDHGHLDYYVVLQSGMPSPLFGETCYVHLQGKCYRIINHAISGLLPFKQESFSSRSVF
jgi:hypothetical protein